MDEHDEVSPMVWRDLPIIRPREIFQALNANFLEMPKLWSYQDQCRAEDEGWAVGNMVKPMRRQDKIDQTFTACIGKWGGTFVNDEDAHQWVVEQARIRSGPEPYNIYSRALAVVAALTIRMS